MTKGNSFYVCLIVSAYFVSSVKLLYVLLVSKYNVPWSVCM